MGLSNPPPEPFRLRRAHCLRRRAQRRQARHLRRVRRKNTAHRAALLEAIREYLGERVELAGDGAGTHMVLWPGGKGFTEEAVIQSAAAHGVGVYGISGYFLGRAHRAGLMLGYTRMNPPAIREGIRLLAEAFTSLKQS